MKILLAIDDSKYSRVAIQQLIAQISRDAEVRVLHVIEPLGLYPDGQAWGIGSDFAVVHKEQWKKAEELVGRGAQDLRDAGFSVTTAIEEGNPKAVVVDSAGKWHADLIVLGSHGRKGLEHLLMGSVSEAVARYAPCSVQIARIAKR